MATQGITHYENQLNHFKVNELQTLLTHFRVQKMGKKSELHQRCVELLRNPKHQQQAIDKIREIASRANSHSRAAPYPQPMQQLNQYGGHHSNAMGYRPNVYSQQTTGVVGGYYGGGAHQMASNQQAYQPQTMVPRPARNLLPIVLPFYDPCSCLLEPQELPANPHGSKVNAKITINFSISQPDRMALSTNPDVFPRKEIQLRFFNTTGEISGIEQPDDFPLNCAVRLDDTNVTLPNVIPTNKPNVEPKRPSRPVNLTNLCMATRDPTRQHRMTVEWSADRRTWAVAVYLVSRVNSNILRDRVTGNKSFELAYANTEATIRKRLGGGDDDDVAMDSLKISLLCPLGKTRMKIPARSRDCSHLQCFDLDNFLQMNEKRPTWKCCVCNNNASYHKLIIDKYFEKMLKDLGQNVTEVELLKDGSYRVVEEEVEDISDDDDDDVPKASSSKTTTVKTEVTEKSTVGGGGKGVEKSAANDDIIVLSDDDEDEIALRNAIKASLPTIPAVSAAGSTNSGTATPTFKRQTPTVAKSPQGGSSDDSIIILDDTPPRPKHPNTVASSSSSSTTVLPSFPQTTSSASVLVPSSSSSIPSTSTARAPPTNLVECIQQSFGSSMGGPMSAGMDTRNTAVNIFPWATTAAPQSAPPMMGGAGGGQGQAGWPPMQTQAQQQWQQMGQGFNAYFPQNGGFSTQQIAYQYGALMQQQPPNYGSNMGNRHLSDPR